MPGKWSTIFTLFLQVLVLYIYVKFRLMIPFETVSSLHLWKTQAKMVLFMLGIHHTAEISLINLTPC